MLNPSRFVKSISLKECSTLMRGPRMLVLALFIQLERFSLKGRVLFGKLPLTWMSLEHLGYCSFLTDVSLATL